MSSHVSSGNLSEGSLLTARSSRMGANFEGGFFEGGQIEDLRYLKIGNVLVRLTLKIQIF